MYEEHAARVEAGYILRDWELLEPQERALEVAHFRLRHTIESVQMDEASREARRKQR